LQSSWNDCAVDKEFLKTKELKQKKNVFGKQDELDGKLQELTAEATDVYDLVIISS
jgi:hypothetical protein